MDHRFELLAEALPQIVWICSADGQNVFFNQKWVDYTGLSLEESYGAGWNKPFHPEDQQRAWKAWDDAIRLKGTYSLECRLRRKDGEYRWWLIRGVPSFTNNGSIETWFGTCTDIHDMRVAADRISASERQFRHLFEDSLQAQMLLRGDELVAMNRAALDMLGIRNPADVVGRTPIDFSPELQPCGTDSTTKAKEMIELAFRKGNHEFIWRHRAVDGRVFDVHSTLLIVEVDGEPLVFCVSRDISAEQAAQDELDRHRRHLEALVQERTEQLLEAKSQAEAASTAKGTFLANMSHEIRTPLNAVLGYAQLLQQDIADDAQREQLRQIEHAGNHLLAIVNDILDLAKIESGKLTLDSMPLRIQPLLEEVRAMLGERASAKNLALKAESAPELLDLVLLGDDYRLRQILLNLAANAIKFTERGEVCMRASRVSCDDNHVQLRIEVEDTGIGITQQAQERLFQPFEQAHANTTRNYGGTGLGLAIIRHLVDLMDGQCGVTSEIGRGSTFWFSVRLLRSSADASSTGTFLQVAAPRRGSRVLLVEDNPVNQMVATAMLQRLGIDVETAADGAQAIAAFELGRHDLILMDLNMPVMDGLEAARRIRATGLGHSVPIIAMTASAFNEDRQRCLNAGMNEHIAKPIVAATLQHKLAEWLPSPPQAP